ncbi:COA8 family protein CBG23705, mitochondrial-like [Haliotis cracherodii]|uniref:COA8 family protein CBG23705, mitochondrial-like n=1 Tax=Haliotis cracherodii TaxID=6455 RepID=UPI0039EC8D45
MNCRVVFHFLCGNSLTVTSYRYISLANLQLYRTSATQTTRENQHNVKTNTPPENTTNDWVGPPDSVSNIRPVKYFIPPDETLLEKRYRERRQEVWKWNQEFWEEHNKLFVQKKKKYVQSTLADKRASYKGEGDPPQTLSADEMSVFYKRFLNDNYKSHIWYNKEWYKKNISLLWPALQVNVSRFMKKLKRS